MYEKKGFRIMTYNVNGSLKTISDFNQFKDGLINEISKQDPDILCLQELTHMSFKLLKSSLDSIFNYTEQHNMKNEQYRFWIYSKKPIRNFKRYGCVIEIEPDGLDSIAKIELEQLKRWLPIFSAELEIEPNKWIILFAVHLRSSAYSTARRSMGKNSMWIEGLPKYFHNYKQGAIIRNFESDNLRLHLEALEAYDYPIVLVGDFNDWSGSYCLNTIRNGHYKDGWWEGGSGFGMTYNAWNLKLRLDHILYNHHFYLEKIFVEETSFSDHFPLIADLILLD